MNLQEYQNELKALISVSQLGKDQADVERIKYVRQRAVKLAEDFGNDFTKNSINNEWRRFADVLQVGASYVFHGKHDQFQREFLQKAGYESR